MNNIVSHHKPLCIFLGYSWHVVTNKDICRLNTHEYKSITAAVLSVGPTTSVELATMEPAATTVEPTSTTTELSTVSPTASATAVNVKSTAATPTSMANDAAVTATQQGAVVVLLSRT